MRLLQAIITGIKTQAEPLEKVLVAVIHLLIPEIQGTEGKGHPSVVGGKTVIDILHPRFREIVKREVKENQERTYLLISFWAGMFESSVTSRNFTFNVLG